MTTYTVSHGKTHDSDVAAGFFIFGGIGGGFLAFPLLFDDIVFAIAAGALESVETGKDGKPTTKDETETETDPDPTSMKSSTTKSSTTSSDSSSCTMKTAYDYWVECSSITAPGQSMSCSTTRISTTVACSPTTTAMTTTVGPVCGLPLSEELSEEDWEGEDGGCDASIPCDEPYCYGTVTALPESTSSSTPLNGICQQVLKGCNCIPSDNTPGFCIHAPQYCNSLLCLGKEIFGKWICTGLFIGCPCTPTQKPPTPEAQEESTTSNSTTVGPTPLPTSNSTTMMSNSTTMTSNYTTMTINSTMTTTPPMTMTTSSSVPTQPFIFEVVTAGTGCGNVMYYNTLQADYVSPEQCLEFCAGDPSCLAVSLQCSPLEPCECNVYEKSYALSKCDLLLTFVVTITLIRHPIFSAVSQPYITDSLRSGSEFFLLFYFHHTSVPYINP